MVIIKEKELPVLVTVLDTVNGGGDMDINGNPEVPKSGRNALVGMNESQSGIVGPNGFGPAKPYYPDYIISADQ